MISWADLPEWVSYLIRGLSLTFLLCFSAVILSRAGRNPYWALLTIVPFAIPLAVWVLAYVRWPEALSYKKKSKSA